VVTAQADLAIHDVRRAHQKTERGAGSRP
jgi:hypothetical protein